MNLVFTDEAKRDLRQLDHTTANRIVTKFLWLKDNFVPHIQLPLTGKLKGFYKLRVGDWRAIYNFNDERIVVHFVDHRSKVYKRR